MSTFLLAIKPFLKVALTHAVAPFIEKTTEHIIKRLPDKDQKTTKAGKIAGLVTAGIAGANQLGVMPHEHYLWMQLASVVVTLVLLYFPPKKL